MNILGKEESLIIEINMKTIGCNLKRLREACGYTQEYVANYFEMSQYYYRQIEKGRANTTIMLLSRLANFFGITLRDLLEDNKTDNTILFAKNTERKNDNDVQSN